MKWEFELDLNTEGGLELSNRLKQKEYELSFIIEKNHICYYYDDLNYFTSLLKTSPSVDIPLVPGDIDANSDKIAFVIVGENAKYQKIGKLINMKGFSFDNLIPFSQYNVIINLVLSYEKIEEPDNTTQIAEMNKKIIIITIIGLS